MSRFKRFTSRLRRIGQNSFVLTLIFVALIVICTLPTYSKEFMDWFPKPQIDWAAFFSLGQFLASVVLIPVILLSFEFQRREFEKAQAKAALSLFWSTLENRGVKELHVTPQRSQDLQTFSAEIRIANKGKAPATQYKIELSGLGALGFGKDQYSGWTEKLGERGQDWKDESATSGRLMFVGMKQEYAIFPGEELALCSLEICLPADIPARQFAVPYTIYVAGDDRKQDSLAIRSDPPTAAQGAPA